MHVLISLSVDFNSLGENVPTADSSYQVRESMSVQGSSPGLAEHFSHKKI